MTIDYQNQTLTVYGRSFGAGDVLTIDGSSGEVMAGAVPTVEPELSGDFSSNGDPSIDISDDLGLDDPDDSSLVLTLEHRAAFFCNEVDYTARGIAGID